MGQHPLWGPQRAPGSAVCLRHEQGAGRQRDVRGDGDESHCSSVGARRQTKRTTQGLPGEPECKKSLTRGRGFPLPPQNFGDFGSRLLCPLQSGRGAARPCCHLTAGRGGGLTPAATGNFPSQTQGDCGTDGTFPLLPPWETKGSYFNILPPSQYRGTGHPREQLLPKSAG